MPILSYRGQSTHRIAIGQSNDTIQKYYNTYLKNIPFAYDYNQGLYSNHHRSSNTYYDSMKNNCLFLQGYVPFCGGDRYDGAIGDLFGSIGSLWIPVEFRGHTFDRSAVTDLSARMKVPITIANYGSDRNGSIRYLPNKKNPLAVDLYPHTLLQIIQSGKQLGGVNKAIKDDIIKLSSNQLANYLANREKYFLDENDNLRSMDVWKEYQVSGKLNLGSVYYPPELDDNYGWGYHIFSADFRRQCANFGYYSMNRLETIYEDNPNAASNYLNAYLKLHGFQDKDIERKYYNIELEEKTYSPEYVFSNIFNKVFGNFNEEDFTFTYKDKIYRIDENTKTIYDENNDEVLFIKLDDGTYFSTTYDKAIVQAIKDEINPYIDDFINFLLKKPSVISMKGQDFYQWYIHTITKVDDESGQTTETYKQLQKYNGYILYPYSGVVLTPSIEKQKEIDAHYINIINEVGGLFMSPNRLDISQLISINEKYNFAYTNISKGEDEIKNASYENSMLTPILIPNYIDYTKSGLVRVSIGKFGKYRKYYAIWGQNPITDPLNYSDFEYCPLPSQLKLFYGDTFLGYNHSNTTEHYAYFPHTTALQSVLDNYVGYEGEGQNIVFKYDSNGNILYKDGLPVIDEEKTTYAEKVDENCNLPLTERLYKVLKKYPYLIDLEHMYIEKSQAYTKTITFNELSRTTIDSSIKDNMGNTLQNYEIEIEPMFQVKEIKYRMDRLPYYKVVTDNNNTQQNIEYLKNYTFSPLFYVFDTNNFNMHLWRSIPKTKKIKFVFMKDIVDELEKVGNNYIECRYSYDNDNGETINESIDIDGDIQSIRLNFSGNKVSYQMVKYCPQVLLAVGSDRVVTRERDTNFYQGGIALQICATVALVMLSSIIASPLAAGFWAAGIVAFLASRRDITCHTIGFMYKNEGDFFYNIGNRWEWVYHKNNGKRPDLWDKFENPSYSMDVRDPSIERTVKRNPPAARIFGDRNFKAKRSRYDPYVGNNVPVGLEYQERPFVLSSFDNDELSSKIGSNSKFKGNRTTKEEKTFKNRYSFTESYEDYFESDIPSNITHIYYGQKMCLTWLLNGSLRRVKTLLQSAYTYLDYLCSIKGIINGQKYVSVIIPHRMQFQSFKKNIRIGKYPLDEKDIALLGESFYKCSIEGDKFYILNKITNSKVFIDFKSYIPDYKSHYSTTNNIANIKASILPEVKRLYNGEDIYSWGNWFKTNINEISHNGDYKEIPKLSDDELGNMEGFIREYLSTYNDEELLKIYNEDNNTDYRYVINTKYSNQNTLDTNGELNQFIDNSIEDNSITTIKNFTLSKIQEGQISGWLGYITINDSTEGNNAVEYRTFTTTLNNTRITYDIRTLCLGYQIALEKMIQGKSEIVSEDFSNKFYTYLDASEGTISKTTLINHMVNKLQDIIPSNILITIDEMRDILSVANKYTALFDINHLNSNSIAYNLWIGYYVCPNAIKDKLQELQDEIVSWKVLLEKNAIITRNVTDINNSISSMLPMYQDVWKKLTYNAKMFYAQFSFTYDLYYEQLVPQKMGGYDAVLVRTFIIWKGMFLQFLAVVIAIVLAVIAIIAAIPTGGTSLSLLAVAIAILATVSALLLTVSFVLQAIGAYSSNPSTQRRYRNMAKSFSQASQIVGAITAIVNVGASIQQLSVEAAKMTAGQLATAVADMIFDVTMLVSGIVSATTNNDSVRRTWGYVGIGAATGKMLTTAKWTKVDDNGNKVVSASLVTQNIMKISTNILALTNKIISDIYNRNLQSIQADIDNLEKLYKEYEKELEEAEAEVMTNKFYPMKVFSAKRPLNLSQYEDAPNLLLSNALNLPSTDTDEIIETTFEVLNT